VDQWEREVAQAESLSVRLALVTDMGGLLELKGKNGFFPLRVSRAVMSEMKILACNAKVGDKGYNSLHVTAQFCGGSFLLDLFSDQKAVSHGEHRFYLNVQRPGCDQELLVDNYGLQESGTPTIVEMLNKVGLELEDKALFVEAILRMMSGASADDDWATASIQKKHKVSLDSYEWESKRPTPCWLTPGAEFDKK
jgi:hypothetical protein